MEQPLPARRRRVFVTVGMGPWPFDRLVAAIDPLCASYDVFAQTGSSTVHPDCPHQAFLGWDETQRRLREADVVVTHGGNTVRLVQRLGQVPVVVAREASRGEMRDDHQVRFVADEERSGRVVAAWGSPLDLLAAVQRQQRDQAAMLSAQAPAPAPADPQDVAALLESLAFGAGRDGQLLRDPTARYAWAFDQLADGTGRHLDLGVGDGRFTVALHERTDLDVFAADPHAGYLRALRAASSGLPLVRCGERLPFADASFDSVSMLDVLEHTPDDERTLREVRRVLRSGGLLVLTVPARHAFSFLDPDNAKLRLPRLHRLVYTARFGGQRYHERFVDDSDGLRGDLAWTRAEHTNYRPADLLHALAAAGFVPQARDGANLFWRLLHVPSLLAPDRVRRLFDAPMRLDARLFARANLFLTARRSPE